MTHASPASYLVWTGLCVLHWSFLLFHLWSFDRFKCLRWNNGPHNGAFKRVMTYSYLVTVPLISVYTLGNTIIKYNEGFVILPGIGAFPKPHQGWSPLASKTVFPLMLVFSVAWSLEMVTHLEELCFWLFLVNSGSSQQNWFQSHYFKTWIVGSIVAVAYMPIITILTKEDPLKSEAYTFLGGSLGSLSLTLWFTPILWTFPSFLNNLRREGVDVATVVRLTKFSELNTIRVIFRFMFTVPLLILGIDGVKAHNEINEKMVYTDLLIIIAGFGCAISSALTLLIFFPRSIEGEIAARDAEKERKRSRNGLSTMDGIGASQLAYSEAGPRATSPGGTYLLTSSPVRTNFGAESFDDLRYHQASIDHKKWVDDDMDAIPNTIPPLAVRPNRRRGDDIELGGVEGALTESNLSIHNQYAKVNPAVANFTSPIDFAYTSQGHYQKNNLNGSRLTFSRK